MYDLKKRRDDSISLLRQSVEDCRTLENVALKSHYSEGQQVREQVSADYEMLAVIGKSLKSAVATAMNALPSCSQSLMKRIKLRVEMNSKTQSLSILVKTGSSSVIIPLGMKFTTATEAQASQRLKLERNENRNV